MSSPSPLQLSSGSAFGGTAFAPAFGSAPMGAGAPHMYTNSSGPLSPQLSQVCCCRSPHGSPWGTLRTL